MCLAGPETWQFRLQSIDGNPKKGAEREQIKPTAKKTSTGEEGFGGEQEREG